MKKNISAILVLSLLMLSFPSQAFLINLTVSPANLNANNTSGLSTSVSWAVTLDDDGDVGSGSGQFLDASNNVLLTVNTPFNIPQPVTTVTINLNETITLSASQVQTWLSAGHTTVRYRRQFADLNNAVFTAQVTINLQDLSTPPPNPNPPTNPNPPPNPTPPPVQPPQPVQPPAPVQPIGLNVLRGTQSTELTLHRLELRFEDLKTVKFVDSGESLKAELQLSYSGVGILRGQWHLADPASSVGDQLQFRSFAIVNKQLSDSQRSEILSPDLPTDLEGRYYLRFCVTAVGNRQLPAGDDPSCPTELLSTVVGYQVFPDEEVSHIAVTAPKSEAVNAATEFSWPTVAGAVIYQLQILSAERRPETEVEVTVADNKDLQFVTGMLLPSAMDRTRLSEYVISRLNAGYRYYWRITAHNADGRLLARSEPRLFSYEGKAQLDRDN